jgi:hypothetical protein
MGYPMVSMLLIFGSPFFFLKRQFVILAGNITYGMMEERG